MRVAVEADLTFAGSNEGHAAVARRVRDVRPFVAAESAGELPHNFPRRSE